MLASECIYCGPCVIDNIHKRYEEDTLNGDSEWAIWEELMFFKKLPTIYSKYVFMSEEYYLTFHMYLEKRN